MKHIHHTSISYANSLLDELDIQGSEGLNDLISIFKKKNIKLRFEPLTGCLGRTQHPYGNPVVTISNQIQNPARLRFTMAHELGHIILGHKIETHVTTEATLNISSHRKENLESEANSFAAHFLAPDRFLRPIVESNVPSMNVVDQIADRFGIAKVTAGIRYTDVSSEPVAFLVSSKGVDRWKNFSKSTYLEKEGLFIPDVIPSDSILAKLMNARLMPDTWHAVPASEWFRNRKIQASAKIKEWSRYNFTYDRGLTLLFVDDDLYED